MKLVEGWRNFWKWNSVQVMAVLAVLPIVWMEIPPDVKEMVPLSWRPWIMSTLAISAIFARLRNQTK